ncbi:hypothetical protein OG2516_18460 [Oceanicola granulosus HTCC2516]|uniref:Uncharacterized protein n=1 Tax=Oceanicola granulosus (strain ATCC BAA-861 / DSM 15982 / KCTC 12143 / HTCC2516) TaxID=314256 RepID=Q2CHG4_OCEGH|nr:hypothetical protein OG2516_18460 [Oceanicola granulosus HTCC2516]
MASPPAGVRLCPSPAPLSVRSTASPAAALVASSASCTRPFSATMT